MMGLCCIVLHCVALKIGLGSVLMQHGKVISYTLRQPKNHTNNYPIHDLELALMMFTLNIWHHNLYGVNVDIFIDHKSL